MQRKLKFFVKKFDNFRFYVRAHMIYVTTLSLLHFTTFFKARIKA